MAKRKKEYDMKTIRLTMSQALIRYLTAQFIEHENQKIPLFGGCFAIFGHGNVSGIGEALFSVKNIFPTYRGHNEQSMAHAAIAFAKSNFRRRMMAVTSSIGPGATNLVTAAALAHVNRLPLLLLPGDVFTYRGPDPVLQQLEYPQDGTVSVNDCFRPVSRYFDRIVRPEQLLTALPRALSILTDDSNCGPVTLSLPQDVQSEAYSFPLSFFDEKIHHFYLKISGNEELNSAIQFIKKYKKPLIIAGGGVLYSKASNNLQIFAEQFGIPVCETQSGKSALKWDHPLQMGSIGVTGSHAANTIAKNADLIIAIGTRLQDFTTGSNLLFQNASCLSINVNAFDSIKFNSHSLNADANWALLQLSKILSENNWQMEDNWTLNSCELGKKWRDSVTEITSKTLPPSSDFLPYEGEIIGAIQRSSQNSFKDDIIVSAAGGIPAELHKLWRSSEPGGYHCEYGFSCMGYEIAGGLGVKMANPNKEVIVMVGDGSYLMLNSELATSIMLDLKIILVILDNKGYGCIHRLQKSCGNEPFNNMLKDCNINSLENPNIDFALHAKSLGAVSEHVTSIFDFEHAMLRARKSSHSYVIVIDTDYRRTTELGGCWWEVSIPETSQYQKVNHARQNYQDTRNKRL
ncbi:3D-(3,5/4)-trihydroxycyclohexane-1,2-dione acylhydrolase (decyclizing) [Silvanigrella paludirubra]|uniref:3D-(3,5/4)-trihydroxycyclohexane-1,2-dione acylhydrolase (Decyclizing) n=2 Tax=Silvanigrella paludirubra TaxID=2499159 RepID=A0A6N6VWB7_9BACT|nr:3D-(3,5/4)-trihydroxycyclohexane-1,2-dione acylhydrolase (decyclizing) [Silvanigrella paludirubra]